MTTIATMSPEARANVVEWARSHDWGRNAAMAPAGAAEHEAQRALFIEIFGGDA